MGDQENVAQTRRGRLRSRDLGDVPQQLGGSKSEELPAVIWRDAAFPFLLDVPVKPRISPRKKWTRGELRNTHSRKTGLDIVTTSKAERRLTYECEWDDDVEFFVEQPFEIRYLCAGRPAKYPPDMYRLKCGRHEIVEAKTTEGAAAKEWTEREPWIREALLKLGFQLVVWVLETEAPEPRASNIWRQLGDRTKNPPDCVDAVCAHLRAVGPTPLRTLTRDLGVQFEPLRIMVAHGLLDADIDQPFDEDVILSCEPDGGEMLLGSHG